MKKLLALALALIMALGCAGAFAEEAAPAYGIDTQVQLTLSHNIGPMLIGMATGNYDEQMSEAILDVLDSMYLDIACGGNVLDMALMGNDAPLTALVGMADENGVTLVGDLFPHYALRVEKAEIEALAQQLSEQLQAQFQQQLPEAEGESVQLPELSEEEMQALMEDMQGYSEDINAFLTAVQSNIQASEDGTTAVIPLTTHQLAGLGESLLNRLSADEVLKPYLQMIIDQANARLPEDQQVTLEQVLAMAGQKVAELKAAEDTVLVTVTLINNEDGSTYMELNAVNQVLLAVTTVSTGMDATMLISKNEITDAEALLNAITDGSNAEDAAVQLSIHRETDENGVDNNAFGLELLYGGIDVGLTCNNAQTGAGTIDYVSHTIGALSVNLLGGDLVQLEVVTMADDIPVAPELGERTVLDPLKLTDEEKQALIKDVTNYGIPALAAACVQAMPDQVAELVELGINMRKLSFQSGEETEDWESYDYSEDEYQSEDDEEAEADDGIDLTGVWTAPDGSQLILNADGTFQLTYATKETQGTWYKFAPGSMMLDTERVGQYCDYTEDTITTVIGFEELTFTR